MRKSGKIVLVGLGFAAALGCFIGGTVVGTNQTSASYAITIQENEDKYKDLLQQKDEEIERLKEQLSQQKELARLKIHLEETDIPYPPLDFVAGPPYWSDGSHAYFSGAFGGQFVLQNNTWEEKSWNISFDATSIWTDGSHIYCSTNAGQPCHYVLNDDVWLVKDWNYTDFKGCDVWSDGDERIYISSYNDNHYELQGDVWVKKSWGGEYKKICGDYIWKDGGHIYCSQGKNHYELQGNDWVEVSFNFPNDFDSDSWSGQTYRIWSDGFNPYISLGATHYVFNNGSWELKNWNIPIEFDYENIWTDGTNYYVCASNHKNYIFCY